MSFESGLTTVVRVYARRAASDEWRELGPEAIRIRVTPLSLGAARTESVRLEPDVTHRGRARPDDRLQPGRRLRCEDDGTQFVIRSLRQHDHPLPGQVVLALAQVADAQL